MGTGGLERRLELHREFLAPDGTQLERRRHSLLLARNVGHLMATDAVLDSHGAEIPRR